MAAAVAAIGSTAGKKNSLLTEEERRVLLKPLMDSSWALAQDRESMRKSFDFDGFPGAMAFMTQCAMRAEKLNHHPEWTNIYNKVDVTLTTHDPKGLSLKDIKLADYMESIAQRFIKK